MTIQTRDKGYHIRGFDKTARRMAKAGAGLAGTDIGEWIARAVREKFVRDFAGQKEALYDDPQAPHPTSRDPDPSL